MRVAASTTELASLVAAGGENKLEGMQTWDGDSREARDSNVAHQYESTLLNSSPRRRGC